MKTIAYFASGIEKMDLSSFGYDRIILVDNGFKTGEYNIKIENNKTIIRMGCDAITAVDILKDKKIKLDCFISINEGLYEGGGNYPLNGEYFLSYLSPILKNTYYHLYAPNYYNTIDFRTLSSKNVFRKGSFYKEKEVDFKIAEIIPSTLNNAANYKLKCFQMQRKIEETYILDNDNKVKLIYGNIWNHIEEFEYVFLPSNKLTRFIKNHKNIHWFLKGNFPFNELENVNCKIPIKIAILPWYSKNYKVELGKLVEFAKNKNIQIDFFFQDSRDKQKYIS
jgi:hypothetical protein